MENEPDGFPLYFPILPFIIENESENHHNHFPFSIINSQFSKWEIQE